ncbi:hypothetical protein SAMN05661080_03083 [Modestobacter sp. DSM 44400]|uniref:hypothetical protein n=1 Tax=Modestobacter sp. DSM 44400 TaxID=1550230 RepID=UPI0008966CC8|nr:hypothetical protein [Modestobacter sp. DSM 44400]SDY32498.1 hypothetical protein SAMN05661080_03083 [Modestobacter sp. DSM 44400]
MHTPPGPPAELLRVRLVLRLITHADVAAVVEGRRPPGWAAGFPAPGDVEIAGLLTRIGVVGGVGYGGVESRRRRGYATLTFEIAAPD